MTSDQLFPDNWEEILIENVFELVPTTNKKIKTKDCKESGLFPVIDQSQVYISGYVNDPSKVIKVSSKPLIVFGDHTKVIKWVSHDFVPGADGTKILSPSKFVEPRYFYFFLRALELPDKGYARHYKYLKESAIKIPPLAEQKQIADRLDALLAQVDTLKTRLDAIPAILKRFRQSVLAAAVSGKLTEGWRNINPDMKWDMRILKDISLSISDGDHQAPPKSLTGIPFLVISNISSGLIDFDSITRWVNEEYYDSLKSIRKPNRGDILYTVTGSYGISVMVDTDVRFCFQRHIAIIKPDKKLINSKFLLLTDLTQSRVCKN